MDVAHALTKVKEKYLTSSVLVYIDIVARIDELIFQKKKNFFFCTAVIIGLKFSYLTLYSLDACTIRNS